MEDTRNIRDLESKEVGDSHDDVVYVIQESGLPKPTFKQIILDEISRERKELHDKHPDLKNAWEEYEILRQLKVGNDQTK